MITGRSRPSTPTRNGRNNGCASLALPCKRLNIMIITKMSKAWPSFVESLHAQRSWEPCLASCFFYAMKNFKTSKPACFLFGEICTAFLLQALSLLVTFTKPTWLLTCVRSGVGLKKKGIDQFCCDQKKSNNKTNKCTNTRGQYQPLTRLNPPSILGKFCKTPYTQDKINVNAFMSSVRLR